MKLSTLCPYANLKTAKPLSQLGGICSKESIEQRLETIREKSVLKLKTEVKKREHKIVSGTFENQESEFEIFELIHKKTQMIKFSNSMRRKYGFQCCFECF